MPFAIAFRNGAVLSIILLNANGATDLKSRVMK